MKVLIIGCARSGYYAALVLHQHNHQITITDAKAISQKEELISLGIEVYDEGHPEHLKEVHWDYIVKNPGIPYHVPFVQYFVNKQIPIFNEFEIGLRYADKFQLAAITGTNGKTTTTSLLYDILKTSNTLALVGGNIGTPFCELVYQHADVQQANVAIEISAFQLVATPSFHPLVSVVMNLTPDHLDYFSSLDEYYRAKMLVYQNQTEEDWFLRNIDDEEVMKYAIDIPCKVIDFSITNLKADLRIVENDVYLWDTFLFSKKDLKIVGDHNLVNAMVAACMAFKMGVEPNCIQKSIQQFMGVEHRIEYVDTINGVKYYNDSKATNCDSTIAALKAFSQPVILLAGGYDKKTGFKELEPYKNTIKQLIVYGATKHELKNLKEDAHVVNTLEEATKLAHTLAHNQDIVLFSPACASYDQFNNFEERGQFFKQYVKNLSAF